MPDFEDQKVNKAGCRWLMPVILATQEAEIEGGSLKSAQANSLGDLISKKKKKNSQKRVGGVVQGVRLEFKPQHHQKKKKM
jgi:hypothetical protein